MALPFWGVLSKTSALRYVWRKTALQIQCNPPQPRAKHTTPPHVIIAIWHHVHNNFIFPHDTFLDTQTTMRFCICVLEHLKANCDLFISVNYLLPPAALLRQPNGAVRVCCVVLRCAVLFLCCCCALSCCIVVCCCCVVLCCVVTYFAVLSHILLLGVCEFLALLRQPNGLVYVSFLHF